MAGNIWGFIILLVLGVAIPLLVYLLVRKSLRALLNEVAGLPAAAIFYARLLLLGVLFTSLAAVLEVEFDLKRGSAFMEYVWKVADGLSSAFGLICLFLTGFLIVITIIVAALRRRHE